MLGVMPCGCGQCMPCRINRRRLWTHRLILESLVHGDSSFVTLTYSPQNVPEGGTLVPKHAQDWLKRLRWHVEPRAIRFFLVGEYGDETFRPHYHAALFGVGRRDTALVEKTWGFGHVVVGDLTPASASYVCGYVTKKLTAVGDPRLGGKFPEFSRMSLRPGIGGLSLEEIVKVLFSPEGQDLLMVEGDVPRALRHGGKLMPLGRYLRRKLREKIGRLPSTPTGSLQSYGAELRLMFEEALKDEAFKASPLRKIFVDKDVQKIRNIESRAKLYSQEKKL